MRENRDISLCCIVLLIKTLTLKPSRSYATEQRDKRLIQALTVDVNKSKKKRQWQEECLFDSAMQNELDLCIAKEIKMDLKPLITQ